MYPFELPALPYAYDALEPYIDAATMHLHHDRHLAAYVEGLNKALSGCPRLQTLDLKQLICTAGRYPDHVRVPILRNAGGVFNHEFFFSSLTPETDQCPSGALKQALERDFGHPAAFQRQMTDAAMSVFGSGYAWLVFCKGRLRIVTTCNQETPLPQGMRPILNIDVWEHAYYLQYQNLRKNYLESLFHVLNWSEAATRYHHCMA